MVLWIKRKPYKTGDKENPSLMIQIPKSLVIDYEIEANETLFVTKHKIGNAICLLISDEKNREELEERL